MKKCLAIMAILLLVMAFGITGAIAEPMGHDEGMHCGMMHEGMMGEHHVRMMMAQLGLDDMQKEKIEAIITRTKKDMISRKAELEIAEIDLKSILSQDPVDMKAAESKLKQIEAMKTAMTLVHLNAIEEGKAVLTPEQRAKMKGMMHKHMMGGGMKDDDCGCSMMKHDMMEKMEHHDHEKMMK